MAEQPTSVFRRNPAVPVTLNVYDLDEGYVASANSLLKCFGTGAYHCGVEVHGTEWSYGCNSGIFECDPRGNTAHSFKQSVSMGRTNLSETDVLSLIDELADQWLGSEYHLLRHNCCDFSNDLCKRLEVGAVPGWVKSAAGLGATLDDIGHARPVTDAVSQGKQSRGVAAEESYQFGDFTRGLASKVSSATGSLMKEGYNTRAASEGAGAHQATDLVGKFSDVTRGTVSTIGQMGSSVVEEGKRARDASSSSGYQFGDITRGLISSLAKR